VICRLTGRVAAVTGEAVVLELGGVCYEVLVPASAVAELEALAGEEITLHTIEYFEGNPAGSHLVPRIIGFLSATDRAFFNQFTKVKGISIRRGLRAMGVPTGQLADAIERGDARMLMSLPEVGKKTAGQIIADLQGKLHDFVEAGPATPAGTKLTDAQQVAASILVQWGDRRADAEHWIAAAVEADPALSEPDAIVRAAYRAKESHR